jgi:hypothetical protein
MSMDAQPIPASQPTRMPTPSPMPQPSLAALSVSSGSTLALLGTTNEFDPQQVGVVGEGAGGPFTLASSLTLPRIPLAFGQSIAFSQTGAAEGSCDTASGEVTLTLRLEAVDSNGNAAPITLALTTGTVVTRNANGALISLSGQARAAETGLLRLVGVAKIPTGFQNGAEDQIVTIEVLGSLTFPAAAAARTPDGSASSGAQGSL